MEKEKQMQNQLNEMTKGEYAVLKGYSVRQVSGGKGVHVLDNEDTLLCLVVGCELKHAFPPKVMNFDNPTEYVKALGIFSCHMDRVASAITNIKVSNLV